MTTAASVPIDHAVAPMKRPLGVTILGILWVVGGVAMLLGAMVMLLMSGAWGAAMQNAFGLFGALFGGAISVLLVMVAAAFFAMAYGFFKRMTWAWWLALILTALGALSSLSSLVQGEFSNIINLAFDIFIIWYLTAPGVQLWFKTSVKVPWHKTA